MGTASGNFNKTNLASANSRRLLVATYLITLSVISHVGSSTAPDSSVAFEISNITRDVAHTMGKYWSARFIPGPGGNHRQTVLTPHDHLRTFSASKAKHIIRVRFRRVSHEPFRLEMTWIGVYSRIVADPPASSLWLVEANVFRRSIVSPNVNEHHSALWDKVSLIHGVFQSGVRHPCKNEASRRGTPNIQASLA